MKDLAERGSHMTEKTIKKVSKSYYISETNAEWVANQATSLDRADGYIVDQILNKERAKDGKRPRR